MRSLLITVSLFVVPALLNAQITIYSGDMPVQPGISDTHESTDHDTPVDLGSPGPGQSWNYSAMVTEWSDTGLWVDPADTPQGDEFPDANCCRAIEQDNGAYVLYWYYNLTTDGFWMIGIGYWIVEQEYGFTGHYESTGPVIELPLEYGSSWSVTFTAYDFEGEIASVTDADFNVDAWGTVTDYLGTYACLRLQQFSESTDYEDGEPGEVSTEWMYQWMVPDYGGIVFIDSQQNEPDENFTMGKFSRLTEISEAVPPNLPVIIPTTITMGAPYPNPFNPSTQIPVQLAYPTELLLQAYDLNGRLVATLADGSYTAGEQQFTFDGSGLASGVYLVRMIAPGQTALSQKLLLIK